MRVVPSAFCSYDKAFTEHKYEKKIYVELNSNIVAFSRKGAFGTILSSSVRNYVSFWGRSMAEFCYFRASNNKLQTSCKWKNNKIIKKKHVLLPMRIGILNRLFIRTNSLIEFRNTQETVIHRSKRLNTHHSVGRLTKTFFFPDRQTLPVYKQVDGYWIIRHTEEGTLNTN